MTLLTGWGFAGLRTCEAPFSLYVCGARRGQNGASVSSFCFLPHYLEARPPMTWETGFTARWLDREFLGSTCLCSQGFEAGAHSQAQFLPWVLVTQTHSSEHMFLFTGYLPGPGSQVGHNLGGVTGRVPPAVGKSEFSWVLDLLPPFLLCHTEHLSYFPITWPLLSHLTHPSQILTPPSTSRARPCCFPG